MHRPQAGEAEWPVVERHIVGFEIELAEQQLEHLGRHAMVDLEPHGATEATTTKLHLDGGKQVVGFFFFECEVSVARDAERHEVDDVHPVEERREVRRDHLLEGHEALTVRSDHEPWEQRRHLDRVRTDALRCRGRRP